jgi:hypothetical protein
MTGSMRWRKGVFIQDGPIRAVCAYANKSLLCGFDFDLAKLRHRLGPKRHTGGLISLPLYDQKTESGENVYRQEV